MKTITEMRDDATKRAGELADVAQKTGKTMLETGKKAAFAVVGAPAVTRKRAMEYGSKLGDTARKEFDAWATEGERLTGQLREAATIEELKERVDFDQLQGRVEKLRDQLEEVLVNWRESFMPETEAKKEAPKPAAKRAPAKKAPASKPAASKPAAKKTTTAAKKPAAAKAAPKIEA